MGEPKSGATILVYLPKSPIEMPIVFSTCDKTFKTTIVSEMFWASQQI